MKRIFNIFLIFCLYATSMQAQQLMSELPTYKVNLEPLIGVVTKPEGIELYDEPEPESFILDSIAYNTELFVFSSKTIYGYYKVVDVSSGVIGWVKASGIKITDVKVEASTGSFDKIRENTDVQNGMLYLYNDSPTRVTLIMNNKTYYLPSYQFTALNLEPGDIYYVATFPGKMPEVGVEKVEKHAEYEMVLDKQ